MCVVVCQLVCAMIARDGARASSLSLSLPGGGKLTVVGCTTALDAHHGAVDHDAAALGLLAEVVDGQGRRVHDPLQADVQEVVRRLLQVAVLIHLGGEVVGTGPEPCVGEDMVDAPVNLLGLLEECDQVCPLRDIRLDKGDALVCRFGRGCNIAIDDRCSQ